MKIASKKMDKLKMIYKTLSLTIMIATSIVTPAMAQPKIVSGTGALFKAASGWLLFLIPLGASAFLGYHAWTKSLTEDEAAITAKNRLMKNAVIGAIIGESAAGIVTIVLSFYA